MGNKPKSNYAANPFTLNEKDQFQTPEYAFAPLIPYLRKAGIKTIWESACGEGYLVQWLANAGFDVTGTDLLGGHSRLAQVAEPGKRRRYEGRIPGCVPSDYHCEITNLPFSLKYIWLEIACNVGRPFAFLAPTDMIMAGRNFAPLTKKYDIEILAPYQRIDYKTPNKGWEGSNAQMHTSWFTMGLGIGRFFTYVDIVKPSTRKPKRDTGQLVMPL